MKAEDLKNRLQAMRKDEILILERRFEHGGHALLSFKRYNDPDETCDDLWVFWTWGVKVGFTSCFVGADSSELCLIDSKVGINHCAELDVGNFEFYYSGE